jgi:hypothetical protein
MARANTSNDPQPRRRWFSFSLRTLFVVMTLLACWLGWELSVIRERKAVRQQLAAKGTFQFTTSAVYAERYQGGPPPSSIPKISMIRTWLGDEAIAEIWHSYHHDEFFEADRKLAAETFPEAEIKEWLPEPCHPGCFPTGTLVDTPEGPRTIESIVIGDLLHTILAQGEVEPVAVQSIFVTTNRIWRLETDAGVLLTTETQPLCSSMNDLPVAAGQLSPGDELLFRSDGRIRSARIHKIERTERIEKVFNLVLRNSEIFVAGGFLARSKPPAETATGHLQAHSH